MLARLEAGDTCIVAARRDCIAEVEKRLIAGGTDAAAMSKLGRYIALEADDALSQFVVEGMPDSALFMEYMGSIIEDAAEKGGVRIFGELVAKLAADNNIAACLRLEELWNELQSHHSFTLYCAYPSGAFADEGGLDAVLHACNAHAKVIPDESYTTLPSADDRLRNVAYLQQWNKQLKAELEELEKRIAEREGKR